MEKKKTLGAAILAEGLALFALVLPYSVTDSHQMQQINLLGWPIAFLFFPLFFKKGLDQWK